MRSEHAPARRPVTALRAAVSDPLSAAVREAWRLETLEPRLLLSADPLVAGLMALAPGGADDGPAAYRDRGGELVPLSDPPAVLSTDLVAAAGNIDLGDSVRIDGSVRIEASAGSVRLGNENTDYVGGHTAGSADTLLVVAADDVRFFGAVGDGTAASDALAGLTIQAGDDVIFDREVIVDGNLVIEAGGVVTFNDRITLRNGGELTITGATQIVLKGAVALQLGLAATPGDVLLEADEIDLTMGSELFSGGGTLTLRPATLAAPIALLSPAGALSAGVLNLETAELRSFADGFAGIVIGHQGGDGRAAAGAGAVTIGANTGLDGLSFFDPAAVYGGSITVADYSNPSAMLRLGEGDALTLEAVGDITLANEVEADALTLVSTAGAIVQVDAGADDLAGEAVRTLALSASAATGITLPSVEAATVQASNGGSGELEIGLNAARTTSRFDATDISGSVEVLGLAQTDAGSDGGITLTAAAGSITLAGSGVAIAGGGGLALDAQGDGSGLTLAAPVVLVDGPVTLAAAGALVSTAAGSISASGASAVSLSAGGALQLGAAVSTVGGTVSFASGGSLDFSGITLSAGPGGSLALEAQGDLVVGIVEADIAITLRSLGGRIVDGLDGDGANLRGSDALATLNAATGIGSGSAALRTEVGTLQAQTDAGGGIFVRDESALTVAGLATAGSGDGAIAVLAASGALTVTGAVTAQADGSGHVLLQALDGDLDLQAEVLALGGSISLVASQALALQGAAAFDVRAAASGQTLDLRAGGTLAMAGDVRLLSQGGAQRVAAGGGLVLGHVDAGSGDVALVAGDDISLAADGSVPDVAAGSLRLEAGGSLASSARALQSTATALAAAAGGGAWLASTGELALDTRAGVVVHEVQADGSTRDGAAASDLAGLASGGVGVLDAGGALQVDAAVSAASHLRLASAAGLTLAAAVSSSGGQVSLLAGGDLLAGDAGHIDTGGGGLDLDAGGALTFGAGQTTTTAGGDLRLVAAGDAAISRFDAGAGALSLTAASLAATASLPAGGADLAGTALRLSTTTGDAGSATRALALQVQSLAAAVAGAWHGQNDGDLAIDTLTQRDALRVGSDGALETLAGADAAVDGLVAGSVLVLQATGVLTVDAAVQAGAALHLAADDALALAADLTAGGVASLYAAAGLTVDAALMAASLDGQAGADLTMSGGSVLSAAQQRWQAGGALVLGQLVATGDVALLAGGDVTAAAAGGAADVQAARLWIDADGGIGQPTDALALAVDTLAARAGGALFLAEADAVQVGSFDAAVDRVAADGSVAAATADGGSGLSAGAALVLDSAGGTLQVDAAVDGSGPLRLAAAGSLAVDAAVSSGGAALTLRAGGAMTLAAEVHSGGGVVDVDAQEVLSMAAGSGLLSAGGDLHLAAGGALQLGRVDAGVGHASVGAASITGLALDAGLAHLQAASLRLQATTGSLGAAGQPLLLAVDVLAAQAAGDTLALANQRALGVGTVTPPDRQQVAADGTLQALAGEAALSGLDGAGFVSLEAQGSLSLEAAVQAGGALHLAALGAAADLVATAAVTSGGAASLLAGRDLSLAAAWQSGGSASAEAGGDLALAATLSTTDADAWLAAGGTLSLAAAELGGGRLALAAQSLLDADGGAGTALQAAAVAVDVAAAVGTAGDVLELQTAALALRAGGAVFVHNDGDLALASVAPAVSRVEADGSGTALAWSAPGGLQVAGLAVLRVAGSLSLDVASSLAGGRLEAEAGSLRLNAALDTSGPLSGLASADIVLAAAGGIGAAGSASVELDAAGQLTMADGAAVSAGSGGLRLAAGGTLTLGSLATDGGVSLLARSIVGTGTGAGTGESDIRADALRVLATGSSTTQGFGSGARPIQLQVAMLAADVAGTGAGGFFAIEADGLRVGQVGPLTVQRVGADGVAGDLTDAALADLVSAGNLVLQSSSGDLRVDDGDADGLGLRSGGNLRLDAVAGDLVTAAELRSTAGHATLLAGGDITLGAGLVLERSGRTVDVEAGGDLTQAVGASVLTVNSDLRLAAGGTLTLDRASAGSGRISLIAADIVEAGADEAADLSASGLRLVSADGIGRAEARLETQVGTVSARATGGGIWLQEADAIRVGDVTATVQRVGLAGTVGAVVDAPQSDLVTTAGNGSIGLATLNGDIDLLDGSAPADGRSLVVHGSGRILLDVQGDGALLDVGGADLAQQGPVTLGSDLRVQGVFEVTAGVGGSPGDGAITIDGALDGNPGGAEDSVALHADGAVQITGPVGALAPLASLHIDGATDVTLGGTVVLTGDLVIEASGVVQIDGDITLAGGALEITGASAVVLAGVTLGAGDLRISADALTVGGRLVGAADALLWLAAAHGGGIGFGTGGQALQIDPALLSQVDGFGALQFGSADSARLLMGAGSTLDTGGRTLTLRAAGDIGVSSIVAGAAGVVLDSGAGTIGEVGDDADADVQAGWLRLYGRGPALAAGASTVAAALEVATARVDVDAASGIVLRDSAADGSVRYNLLADGVLYQQLVAGAEVQREASGVHDVTPAQVAERLHALRAGDRDARAEDLNEPDIMRRPLATAADADGGLPLTATPADAGGWLAQRLLASPGLASSWPGSLDAMAASAALALPAPRVELWLDPLEL